jgi:hypothetical protein
MSWLKVAGLRMLVGEIVHVALKILAPGMRVDHLLVVIVVFFVTTAFGVIPVEKATTSSE